MIKLEKDQARILDYLTTQNWLQESESISGIEVPGDGNMNFTLRVRTNLRSFILKQSRDFVEKYPQVAAPAERSQREAEFYQVIADNDYLASRTPKLLGKDADSNVIIMEDLGAGTDFAYLYNAEKTIMDEDLQNIMRFAARLHIENKLQDNQQAIKNQAMRKLNHEHIFLYPYMLENGLDLDEILPGLKKASAKYKIDLELKEKLAMLGEQYLADGDTLLHGDYFPGSWLKTTDGIKVIDPEFCFHGFPEFEVGVTVAHLMMADQPVETIFNAFKYYNAESELDITRCKQFVGVEIMRRIMGLAQLPLKTDLDKRAQLLETAREYILD